MAKGHGSAVQARSTPPCTASVIDASLPSIGEAWKHTDQRRTLSSVVVKLYSVFFKLVLKHRLQSLLQSPFVQASEKEPDPFGITCRADQSTSPAIPFSSSSGDGMATKVIHIDRLSSVSIRIFLPSQDLTTTAALGLNQAQNSEVYQGNLSSIRCAVIV